MNTPRVTQFLAGILGMGLAGLLACGEPAPVEPSPGSGQSQSASQDGAGAGSSDLSETGQPGTRGSLGFEPGGLVGDADLGEFHVVLAVSINQKPVGELVIDLWYESAPITCRNFLRLVDEGFYDGLAFHRILRDFMVQGGCPQGNGMGNSPHGKIQSEFSEDPDRDHRYGVLSMARMGADPNSASCQFFICCDDGPKLWNLDGKYTTFGRVVAGVPTLEALASVAVINGGREVSKPNVPVEIRSARVVRGSAEPGALPLVRPGQDETAGYKSPRVIVESLLVACNNSGDPRSKSEAQTLAEFYRDRVEQGEDLLQLAAEHSDARGVDQDSRRAVHRILAPDVRDRAGDAAVRDLQQRLQERLNQAAQKLQAHEITREEYVAISKGLNLELSEHMFSERWRPALEFPPGFLSVALDLDVGELGIVPYDPALAPRGFTLLKRIK